MRRTVVSGICAAGLWLFGTSANAAPIFFDDFEGEALGRNQQLDNWTITDGTVDVVGTAGAGFFASLCNGTAGDTSPSHGHCVDLDGSTSNAATMDHDFVLAPGAYTLSYWLSGSERSDTNTLNVTLGAFVVATHVLPSDFPWTEFTHLFVVPAGGASASLVFDHLGGDNLGILLDEVLLEQQVVPEPALLTLLGGGLVAVSRRFRRLSRTRQTP